MVWQISDLRVGRKLPARLARAVLLHSLTQTGGSSVFSSRYTIGTKDGSKLSRKECEECPALGRKVGGLKRGQTSCSGIGSDNTIMARIRLGPDLQVNADTNCQIGPDLKMQMGKLRSNAFLGERLKRYGYRSVAFTQFEMPRIAQAANKWAYAMGGESIFPSFFRTLVELRNAHVRLTTLVKDQSPIIDGSGIDFKHGGRDNYVDLRFGELVLRDIGVVLLGQDSELARVVGGNYGILCANSGNDERCVFFPPAVTGVNKEATIATLDGNPFFFKVGVEHRRERGVSVYKVKPGRRIGTSLYIDGNRMVIGCHDLRRMFNKGRFGSIPDLNSIGSIFFQMSGVDKVSQATVMKFEEYKGVVDLCPKTSMFFRRLGLQLILESFYLFDLNRYWERQRMEVGQEQLESVVKAGLPGFIWRDGGIFYDPKSYFNTHMNLYTD
jgi:hypothetical protein